MFKTTMKIEGMMCGMCEAHICDAIRKAVPSAKKVSASRSKKEASYDCLAVDSAPYVKKGLFGR